MSETKKIMISKGKVAVVDASDYERLMRHKWYAVLRSGIWYAERRDAEQHKHIGIHRAVLNPPPDLYVDHINGDGLDNRRCNLRLATNSQNGFNRKIAVNNTSGFRGVYWHKRSNSWVAKLQVKRKGIWLGQFETAEQAHVAFEEAAHKYHGEFYKEWGR